MCKGRRGWIALLVGLAGATPVAAQDPAANLARMEVRLDSLNRAIAARESAARRARTNDTVVVGGLRVATSAPYRPLVQQAAEEAWRGLIAQFGIAVVGSVDVPVVQWGPTGTTRSDSSAVRELAGMFMRTSARAIWQHEDPVLTGWLRGNVPGLLVDRGDLMDVVVQLARRPARSNVACLEGVASKCAVTIGLGLAADTLGEWYSASTWPRLAELIEGELNGADLANRQSCMSRNDLSACRAVLTPLRLLPPVGAEGRRYLVELALDAGGDSAFQRLVRDRSLPLESRLAAAAGVPLDALLVRWIAEVRHASPRGPLHPSWEFLISLLWSASILILLLRGPRWR